MDYVDFESPKWKMGMIFLQILGGGKEKRQNFYDLMTLKMYKNKFKEK